MLRVIDCCTLLNVLAAWPDLEGLFVIPGEWCICDATANEIHFCNIDTERGPIRTELNIRNLIPSERIFIPETESEQELYVGFAAEVDDGEAMSLAIAKSRGAVLVTDDRKALAIAHRPDVSIDTQTTPSIIKEWAVLTACDEVTVCTILKRIGRLARFVPPHGSADADWWIRLCGADK